jgi:hypothetical protein
LPLVARLLARHAPTDRVLSVNAQAQAALQAYSWPGNVRELENVVLRALVMAHAGTTAWAQGTGKAPDFYRPAFCSLIAALKGSNSQVLPTILSTVTTAGSTASRHYGANAPGLLGTQRHWAAEPDLRLEPARGLHRGRTFSISSLPAPFGFLDRPLGLYELGME